jgi:adenosine deaminase
MGLADLHRHLDGSLRPATVAALADALGLEVPGLPFFPGMGLAAALDRFRFTLSLLASADAVAQVAAEMCEDAAAEGVTTLEIRFAPQLHGPPIPEVIDAALDGAAGRAGLVLCALYGEDPRVLEALIDAAAGRPGVVGVDLAGGPAPGHDGSLASYAPGFRRARDLGLGRTVHAGEGRPPAEIRAAIELLHAQRIGHGTTLLEDPRVADLVLERGITIEACLTSNWHVGAIPEIAAHPLPRWLARGIRACVCADNTLLSETDTRRELERAAALPGMTQAMLERAVRCGHEAAFPRR